MLANLNEADDGPEIPVLTDAIYVHVDAPAAIARATIERAARRGARPAFASRDARFRRAQ